MRNQEKKVRRMKCIEFFMFLLFSSPLFFTSLSLAQADISYVYHECTNATFPNFQNSSYKANLDLVLSSLSSNATAISNGFSIASAGRDPSRVYGLLLCRGDVSTAVCQDCATFATQDMIQLCPIGHVGIAWYDQCFLRYSNKSIASTLDQTPTVMLSNVNNITDPTRFTQISWEIMIDVVAVAAKPAAGRKKFAVKKVNFTAFLELYTMAECTPDLSSSDCYLCLSNSFSYFLDCCSGKQGGRIIGPSCTIRYEVYPFFNVSATIAPPPPPPVLPPLPPPVTVTDPKRGNYLGNVERKLVIGLVVVGVGAAMITCGLIYCIKNPPSYASILASPRRKNTSNNQNIEAFMRKHGPLTLQKYSYSDVKRMTNSFRDKLGQGGYGSVYKGKQVDGRLVAVKVLNVSNGYDGEELINEVSSISRTSHVNVVTLLGFCLEGNQRALIYDFMPNGSLEKFLNNKQNLKVSELLGWEKLHDIAIGVARGLEYLHRGCNTKIVHFDIKPHNILLDQELCPKISDFGLSKLCTTKDNFLSMSMARGTIGYIAPEVFNRQFGGVSHKSDVYSYGMLVLEMVGARTKDEAQTENSSEIYFPQWIYKRLEVDLEFELQQVGISEEDIEIVRKMTIVGLWCIQTNPAERPSISKVIEMLEGPIEALTIPPKPFLSSPVARSPPSYSSSMTSST